MRVGLTGGIGAGKSEAGKIFAGLGALLIDADAIARDVLAPGEPGYEEVRRRWPTVVTPAGPIDRAALAAIVFGDEAQRAELNAIVHPRVRKQAAALEAAAEAGRIVIHEIPLLFESGQGGLFDRTVLVTAPREDRIRRVIGRSGLAREEIERRMAAQIDPEVARTLASFVIENAGSQKDLKQAVERVYTTLCGS